MKYHHKGRCSCGKVSFEFQSSKDLPDQSPRQCDCDYCASHGKPILLSDPEGQLIVTSSQVVTRETQGSGQAEMLFCPDCGNTLGATLQNDSQTIGVVNGALLDEVKRTIFAFSESAVIYSKRPFWDQYEGLKNPLGGLQSFRW